MLSLSAATFLISFRLNPVAVILSQRNTHIKHKEFSASYYLKQLILSPICLQIRLCWLFVLFDLLPLCSMDNQTSKPFRHILWQKKKTELLYKNRVGNEDFVIVLTEAPCWKIELFKVISFHHVIFSNEQSRYQTSNAVCSLIMPQPIIYVSWIIKDNLMG